MATGPLIISNGLPTTNSPLPISGGGTNNGSLPVTAGGMLYTDGTKIQNIGVGTSGQVVQSNGASAPSWANVANASLSYAQAYFGSSASWSTTSGSFVDPTNTGTPGFTVRTSSGITLTAAASSLPGITFTPPSSSAVYLITASMILENTSLSQQTYSQLTDGTTVINAGGQVAQDASVSAAISSTVTLSGIYSPGTTSPVTVKIQLAVSGGTGEINGGGVSNQIEWTVLRIV